MSKKVEKVVLYPTDDATILYEAGVLNHIAWFNDISALQYYNVVPGPLGESRAILEFDISQIQGVITKAFLQLSPRNTDSLDASVAIRIYEGNGKVDPSDGDPAEKKMILSSTAQPEEDLVSMDVTIHVQEFMKSGKRYIGFMLTELKLPDPAIHPRGCTFWSSRISNVESRPHLLMIVRGRSGKTEKYP